jgi:hypothetical protein
MPRSMPCQHYQPLIAIQIAKSYVREDVIAQIALRFRRDR